MKKENLVWRAEKRAVKSLKKWKENPRRISKVSFLKLVERIQERGFHDVIKIDTNGVILSGNQRKDALVKLDVKEVTVLVPNRPLTTEEKEKIGLESNVSDGTWDLEKLKSFDIGTLADTGIGDDVL